MTNVECCGAEERKVRANQIDKINREPGSMVDNAHAERDQVHMAV